MARQQKLKVYRTPIGFHDAYVAAPSQKAALAAWGSDADLFARGAAELVTDEALTREPLDKPGTVVRRARGTTAEHLAALPHDEPARPKRSPAPDDDGPSPRRRKAAPKSAREKASEPEPPPPPPARKPKPRPSRALLDEAERALEQAQTDHDEALADIRRREKELQQQRRDLEHRHEADIDQLEAALDKTRTRYEAALAKWRS